MRRTIGIALGCGVVAAVAYLGAAGTAAAKPPGKVSIFEVRGGGRPELVASGPDGNVWFGEYGSQNIGRVTPTGEITQFQVPVNGPGAQGVASGPDGNLWFTQNGEIDRVTPGGQVTAFTAGLSPLARPLFITAGPDGNLWFTENVANQLGTITPAGGISEVAGGEGDPNASKQDARTAGITTGPDGNLWYTESSEGFVCKHPPGPGGGGRCYFANGHPFGITVGPDGNLWYTDRAIPEIARITPNGRIKEFRGLPRSADPIVITTGPDRNLWFTDDHGAIWRMTPKGKLTKIALGRKSHPSGIVTGPDGNLWFTESQGRAIGRITLAK